MSVRTAKILISLGIRSVWSESLLCAQWVAKDTNFFMQTAKTLIRLGGCPGWSESSMGAHSFCWFCHAAAHKQYCWRNLVESWTVSHLELPFMSILKKTESGIVCDFLSSKGSTFQNLYNNHCCTRKHYPKNYWNGQHHYWVFLFLQRPLSFLRMTVYSFMSNFIHRVRIRTLLDFSVCVLSGLQFVVWFNSGVSVDKFDMNPHTGWCIILGAY